MMRVGIIGCGNVSGTYLYVLANHPDVKTIAVADIDADKAQCTARRFLIGRHYDDYRRMIDCEQLDAVVVATPHFCHHEQVLYAAEKGLNILCEKPLATTMSDVDDIIQASRKVIFSVMLQRRFYPNVQMTKDVIEKEIMGPIKDVSLHFTCHKTKEFYDSWRGKKISGGGTVMSQALHRLDTLIFCFGRPVAVEGMMKITRDYLEVEDYAEGLIHFESGVKARFVSDNSSGDPETRSIISIEGTRGSIVMSDDRTLVWDVAGIVAPREFGIDAIPDSFRPAYYGPCHELVVKDFIRSVREKQAPFVSAVDIQAAMQLIFSFYESSKKKAVVFL